MKKKNEHLLTFYPMMFFILGLFVQAVANFKQIQSSVIGNIILIGLAMLFYSLLYASFMKEYKKETG